MKNSPPTSDAEAAARAEADARYCADAVRAQDGDRYLIALFQPPRLRAAAVALAAWNLELANAAPRSSETTIGMIRLQWHRDALEEIAAGRPRRHPVVGALAAAHAAGHVDLDDLSAIVDARERDLDPAPPESLAELEAYARAAAGALHRTLWRDTPAAAAAEDGATAFALIGLARAEPINQARGRPWAPKALKGDLAALIDRAATLAAVRPPRGHRGAAAPAALAAAYVKRARRAGGDPTDPRMSGPDPWRLWRLGAARLAGRV